MIGALYIWLLIYLIYKICIIRVSSKVKRIDCYAKSINPIIDEKAIASDGIL
mgnify:CR=1 FL=1